MSFFRTLFPSPKIPIHASDPKYKQDNLDGAVIFGINATGDPVALLIDPATGGLKTTFVGTISGSGLALESAGNLEAINTLLGQQSDASNTAVANASLQANVRAFKEAYLARTPAAGALYPSNPYTGAQLTFSNSPPSTLTINTDADYQFSAQAKHVLVQNNSGTDVHINFDAVATAATYVVPAFSERSLSVPVTHLHLYSAAATPVNSGTTDNNIVVLGWA